MTRILEFPLQGGGQILVERADRRGAGGTVRAGADARAVTERAQITFEQALDRVRPAAERVVNALRECAETPETIEVEFGINLSSEVGALIAAVGAEANFKVTLTWKR